MKSLELHPLCTLFPRLAGSEYEALKEDIRLNGLRHPIVLHDGAILDGGNRYRACVELGIEPPTVEHAGTDLVGYVLSVNFHRRHLSPGQMAVIVASATDWARAHGRGGDRKSDQTVTLPFDSVAARAERSGASDKTQRNADKVAKADPELAKAVAHGEMSLPQAVKQLAGDESNVTPIKPPEEAPESDLLADYEAEVAENAKLREALASTDLGKQLASEIQKCRQIEQRLQDEIAQHKIDSDALKRYGKWFAELRKITGTNSEVAVIRWCKAMAATQRPAA